MNEQIYKDTLDADHARAKRSDQSARPKTQIPRPLALASQPSNRGKNSEETMKSQLDSDRIKARMNQSASNAMTEKALPGGSAIPALAGGKEGLATAAQAAAQPVSKEALRQSWLNLIDTIGLTYFYLLFHFIVRYIAGSRLVCRFGEEGAFGLIPKGAQAAVGAAAGEENIHTKGAEMAEIIVFGIITVLLIVSLFINFVIATMPIWIVLGIIAVGYKIF